MDQLNTLPRTKGIIENTNWNLKKNLVEKAEKIPIIVVSTAKFTFWLSRVFYHRMDVALPSIHA